MILIDDILISEALVEESFVCDLTACKGACCWEGDFGAPLETAELHTLEKIYDDIKPFLSPEGIKVIEKEGLFVFYKENKEYGTPLINDGPCAYMVYDELGIAKCGIEQAYRAGVIDFPKPVSCHLYPIRIRENDKSGFTAVNYDRWDICSAACTLGKKEKIPVFQFVKDGFIRKFGESVYEELERIYQDIYIKPPQSQEKN